MLHPDVESSKDVTLYLDEDNEVRPDACLWRSGPDGLRLTDEGYLEGAPRLVCEVATSSASYDLHEKLRVYRRNRVLEYVVWRVIDGAVAWVRCVAGAYIRVAPDADGVIESSVFPGLRLNVPKLLADDLAGVLAELQPGGGA